MREEDLQGVLRGAEFGPRPFVPSELSARVRAARQRQRRRRAVAATCLPLVVVVAFVGWRTAPLGEQQVAESTLKPSVEMPKVMTIEAKIALLRVEAEYHERKARLLMSGSRSQRSEDDARTSAARLGDPLADIREQVDIVAYRMIQRADGLQVDMRPTAEALDIYCRVVNQFPSTYSAEVARQRLNQATASRGESS